MAKHFMVFYFCRYFVSAVGSPVLVGQHAFSSIQWIHIVDEELTISGGHQQPWKLLDPATKVEAFVLVFFFFLN